MKFDWKKPIVEVNKLNNTMFNQLVISAFRAGMKTVKIIDEPLDLNAANKCLFILDKNDSDQKMVNYILDQTKDMNSDSMVGFHHFYNYLVIVNEK